MFEVGKIYRVTYVEKERGNSETDENLISKRFEVVDCDEGLIKCKTAGGAEVIFNPTSSYFVSAEAVS